MHEIKDVYLNPAFIYLGAIDEQRTLQGGLSALHVMLWKFVLIDFVQVQTEGREFKPEKIWAAAERRLMCKMEARGEGGETVSAASRT